MVKHNIKHCNYYYDNQYSKWKYIGKKVDTVLLYSIGYKWASAMGSVKFELNYIIPMYMKNDRDGPRVRLYFQITTK